LKKGIRYFLAVVVLVAGYLTLSYLDHRFDQGDSQRAVAAVRVARPLGPQDASIEAKAAKYFGVDPNLLSWTPNIESKVKGVVQVGVSPPSGLSRVVYQVDLIRLTVTPVTPEAVQLSQSKLE